MPEDVAALVDELTANHTGLRLVNLSALDTRRLIVQAGAFGEHGFTDATALVWSEEEPSQGSTEPQSVSINGKHFVVQLPPGTGIRLEVGTRRFINKPTYAFPWHGDAVPVN